MAGGDSDGSSASSRRTSSARGAALFMEPDFEEHVDADSVALARESRPESASDSDVVADEMLREAGESEPDACEWDSDPNPEPEPDTDPEPGADAELVFNVAAASRIDRPPLRRSRAPPDLRTALVPPTPTGTMASGFVGGVDEEAVDSAVNVLLLPLLSEPPQPGGCSSPSGVTTEEVGLSDDCECERRSSFCLR